MRISDESTKHGRRGGLTPLAPEAPPAPVRRRRPPPAPVRRRRPPAVGAAAAEPAAAGARAVEARAAARAAARARARPRATPPRGAFGRATPRGGLFFHSNNLLFRPGVCAPFYLSLGRVLLSFLVPRSPVRLALFSRAIQRDAPRSLPAPNPRAGSVRRKKRMAEGRWPRSKGLKRRAWWAARVAEDPAAQTMCASSWPPTLENSPLWLVLERWKPGGRAQPSGSPSDPRRPGVVLGRRLAAFGHGGGGGGGGDLGSGGGYGRADVERAPAGPPAAAASTAAAVVPPFAASAEAAGPAPAASSTGSRGVLADRHLLRGRDDEGGGGGGGGGGDGHGVRPLRHLRGHFKTSEKIPRCCTRS